MNNSNSPLLKVPRIQVKSSHIKSIGYEGDSRTVIVEFKQGAIWSYSPITQQGFTEFTDADSKGKYFDEKIKNNTTVTQTCLKK